MANLSLFRTPKEFRIDGISYPGIPVIVDDDTMRIQYVPTEFMIYNAVVRGKSRSPKTWKDQGNIILPFLQYMEERGFDWRQPTEERLAHYRNSLELRRLGRPRISRIMGFIIAFYEWAHRKGHITALPLTYEETPRPAGGLLAHLGPTKNTSKSILVPKIRKNRDHPRFYNKQEQGRILSALTNDRDQLIVQWALLTGAREFEICNLVLDDIPPQTAYQSRRNYPIRIIGKGNKPGDLRVPTWLLDNTYRYAKLFGRRIIARDAAKRGRTVPPNIFLARWGTGLKPDSVYRVVDKAIKTAGLKGSFHDFRHTYAICTLDALMNLPRHEGSNGKNALLELKIRMRHESLETTDDYLKARDFYKGDIDSDVWMMDE